MRLCLKRNIISYSLTRMIQKDPKFPFCLANSKIQVLLKSELKISIVIEMEGGSREDMTGKMRFFYNYAAGEVPVSTW